MYNLKGITEIMRLDVQECSCFGTMQQRDQQFLAKHKTSTISYNTQDKHNNSTREELHFGKAAFKKSLRRGHNLTVGSGCRINKESEKKRDRMEVGHLASWETPDFASPKNRNNPELHAILSSNTENHPHSELPHHKTTRKCHQMFQLRPISMAESLTTSHFPCSPPATALMITYSLPSPWFLTPQQRKPQCKEQLPTVDKTNSPKSPQNSHLDLSISLAHSQLNDFDSLQLMQEHNAHHLPPTAFLKPNNYQSTQQPKRSQLLRMQDVAEICSQADSQSGSDSDNESIVLGRLHEYCSMLQPKRKSSSAILPPKGANGASSSISHFYLPRREAIEH